MFLARAIRGNYELCENTEFITKAQGEKGKLCRSYFKRERVENTDKIIWELCRKALISKSLELKEYKDVMCNYT